METIYNHAFTLAFSVTGSKHETGEDITPEQYVQALEQRISEVSKANQWEEAVGMPFDSFEELPVETKTRWVHRNGIEYEVISIANADTTSPAKYPVTVVYRGSNGKVWTRPLSDWYRSMRPKTD